MDRSSNTTAVDSPNKGTFDGPAKRERPRDCIDITTSMTTALASGVLSLFKSYASSLVTIPYAFTEGFRNMPRLYGEDVGDIRTVRIEDGILTVFVLPYKGAQQEGIGGAIKGFGKGATGLSSKLFVATIGVATYPLRGIHQSIWASARPDTRQSIVLARRIEG
ncbi:hypothetical protein HD806DRAFT_534085 [Xylariaceae sp. AK1471]|nr:hypothetical protein HD806DRAFT_534085 [Xylariaceae sp. AK1471]